MINVVGFVWIHHWNHILNHITPEKGRGKKLQKAKKKFLQSVQPGTQLSIETSGRGRVKLRTSCFFMVTISNLGNLQQKNMADVCLDSDLT